jgi:hypothetical protein
MRSLSTFSIVPSLTPVYIGFGFGTMVRPSPNSLFYYGERVMEKQRSVNIGANLLAEFIDEAPGSAHEDKQSAEHPSSVNILANLLGEFIDQASEELSPAVGNSGPQAPRRSQPVVIPPI